MRFKLEENLGRSTFVAFTTAGNDISTIHLSPEPSGLSAQIACGCEITTPGSAGDDGVYRPCVGHEDQGGP
jgi:hypothetical protein